MKRFLVIWLLSLSVTGCRPANNPPPPKTYKVTGQVIGASGRPLPGGRVKFSPVENGKTALLNEATADIGPDGKFDLVSYRRTPSTAGASGGDGAAAGDYGVSIDPIYYVKGTAARVSGIPARYSDPKTSGLTATVKDGDNHFVFQLR